MKLRALLAVFSLSLAAVVAASESQLDKSERILAARIPVLIQEGERLQMMGVTDDNFAIYQQDRTLYATALVPGARPRVISEVPNGNAVQILQVGKVVLAWLDPQRNFPGYGVSPLVVWSAATGARRISENSAVGLVATDVDPNNLRVIYTTNVTGEGGLLGDLVVENLVGPPKPKTLLSGIRLDFPFGQCRPIAAFIGPRGRAAPTATYCAGEETTATLSRWVNGRKIDVIKNLATPLPYVFATNPEETEFFVRLAGSDHPAVVTDQGKVRVVDQLPGSVGFLTDRGATVYSARLSPTTPSELRMAPRRGAPITVSPRIAALFSSYHNLSGYAKRPYPSPDGRWALYASSVDRSTGLTDLQLLDLHSGLTTTIESQARTSNTFEIFTADSKYALYRTDMDPSTGLSALSSADRSGSSRQLSDASTMYVNYAATGSVVSFNDNVVFDSAPAGSYNFSKGDLRVIDAGRPDKPARLVAEQAYVFYFPSHRRHGLVYTTDNAAKPGLYLASARL